MPKNRSELQKVCDEVAENAYRRARESMNPRRPQEIQNEVVEEVKEYLDSIAPTARSFARRG